MAITHFRRHQNCMCWDEREHYVMCSHTVSCREFVEYYCPLLFAISTSLQSGRISHILVMIPISTEASKGQFVCKTVQNQALFFFPLGISSFHLHHHYNCNHYRQHHLWKRYSPETVSERKRFSKTLAAFISGVGSHTTMSRLYMCTLFLSNTFHNGLQCLYVQSLSVLRSPFIRKIVQEVSLDIPSCLSILLQNPGMSIIPIQAYAE